MLPSIESFEKSPPAGVYVARARLHLVNSLVNLHMKNPAMLRMKDTIANVSTLIQVVRCDKPIGSQWGCVSCTNTP